MVKREGWGIRREGDGDWGGGEGVRLIQRKIRSITTLAM